MKFTRFFLFLVCMSISLATLEAQSLRRAFILGENEEQYDQLRTEYARTLLTVCDNNQDLAVTGWFKLLQAVENYSEKIDFDLNGMKLYLNVFWNADGTIAHIGVLPTTSSKNAKHEDLVAFFSAFIRQYAAGEMKSDKKFSHYTTVAFPTFARKSND